jgi:CCR4-NOT transcription complex subunit 4
MEPESNDDVSQPTVTDSAKAKHNIKALAAETGLSNAISSQAQPGPSKVSTLQDEDFPALDAPKPAANSNERPSTATVAATPVLKSTPSTKKQNIKVTEAAAERIPDSPTPKKAALAKGRGKSAAPINTDVSLPSAHAADNSVAFPQLPTPGSATSPVTKAPKTLRVLPTPKAEVPPAIGSPLAMPQSAASRAMSISHRPDTPMSEMVSDTASLASASVSASRAGSPPPQGKVGAAAVRSTTKSQQRKQRKEAMKQETKVITETPKSEPEEHAPILGRKKKQKKDKAKPVAQVPAMAPVPAEESESQAKPETLESPKKRAAKEQTESPKKVTKGKAKGSEPEIKAPSTAPGIAAKPEPTPQVEPTTVPAEAEAEAEEEADKQQLGPMSIFSEIKSSLWASTMDKLNMLKPVTAPPRLDAGHPAAALLARDGTTPCKDYSCKCGEIQDADLTALKAGRPVRKQFHVDGSRMLITPNGDCIRGLTAEEEDAFLELQAAIADTAEHPGSFVAPRHQSGSGAFSLIKGRAVPNGRPNIFPATTQPQSQDPIGKLQREDALSYINQYVLPRLNLGATNVGWPKGAALRQDAAAASLNSLAPYFYGPDAAAGVGIYSAPDGKDFAPSSSSAFTPGEDGLRCGGPGMSGMPLMSVEDAEAALMAARKETDKLEKGLNQVIKRNRRLLIGGGT